MVSVRRGSVNTALLYFYIVWLSGREAREEERRGSFKAHDLEQPSVLKWGHGQLLKLNRGWHNRPHTPNRGHDGALRGTQHVW